MSSRIIIVLIVIITAGCGGSLSDEQRAAMRQKMEENRILRVTELEITEAAYAEGRRLVKRLDSLTGDSAALKLFLDQHEGNIRFVTPDAANARLLEKQLIDAYLADETGSFQDNVQKLRNEGGGFDSLLYTKPVTKQLEDGSEQLRGVWNIWLSRRDLVLELGNEK